MAPKVPATDSTIRLALDKLLKEAKKPHGNLDKVKRPAVQKTPRTAIKSVAILKRNCNRLVAYLHQRMYHTVALKASEIARHLKPGLAYGTMNNVVDTLEEVSDRFGYDFFKP